jgi:hypothetical protein
MMNKKCLNTSLLSVPYDRPLKVSKPIIIGTLLVVFLLFVLPSIMESIPFASASSGLTVLCSSLPNHDNPAGIYPATGGAFVEDLFNGNLIFCSGGVSKIISKAPPGGLGPGYGCFIPNRPPSPCYAGMGGVETKTFGLVLALTEINTGGLWLCYHATSSGCGSKSAFISLPKKFCSTFYYHFCAPQGTALDASLNLYYVDFPSGYLVECTRASSYQACKTLPGVNGLPVGLYLQGNTFYISDADCLGYVWKGTANSLKMIIAELHEYVTAIALSNNNPSKSYHIYVGVTVTPCSLIPEKPYIYDITDKEPVPGTYVGNTNTGIAGIDSDLQFTTTYPGAAYQITDTS